MRTLAIALVALVGGISAQSLTVPNVNATTEGDSANFFPWGRTNTAPGLRHQSVYDSSYFAAAGSGPIAITRVRWRANATTGSWTGGTYSAALVRMATAVADQAASSTTFASNLGADVTTVNTGPVTYLAGTGNGLGVPGPVVVDLNLSTHFIYNPSAGGDLVIDVDFPSTAWAGGTVTSHDVQSAGALASRIYASTTYGAATGTHDLNHAVVVEIFYTRLQVLTTTFVDNNGNSAGGGVYFDMNVKAPEGVTFDGLGVNCSAVAGSACTLSVYVREGTATGFQSTAAGWRQVVTNAPFTSALRGTESKVSVPPFTLCRGLYGVAVSVTGSGQAYTSVASSYSDGALSLTLGSANNVLFGAGVNTPRTWNGKLYYVPAGRVVPTTLANNNGLGGGVYFDVFVRPPAGIRVTALEINSSLALGTPDTVQVWIRRGTVVGNEQSPVGWTRVANGVPFVSAGPGQPSMIILPQAVFLRQGTNGMVFAQATGSNNYTNGTGTNENYSDDHIDVLTKSACSVLLAPGSVFSPRVWNGALHYQVLDPSVLQYQFDETRGAIVGNGALGTTLPVNGLVTQANWQTDPGRPAFKGNEAGRGALARTATANTNLVSATGPMNLNDSMTVMWWQRMGAAGPGTGTLAYALGGPGGVNPRFFTGGVGGLSMCYRSTFDAYGVASVQAAPNTWQHCCLVVDDAAGRATWYFDGVMDSVTAFTPLLHTFINTNLNVGWNTDVNTGLVRFYDMDDVRIYNVALTHAEVMCAMESENPQASTYGNSCGTATTRALNGLPNVGTGNPAYQIGLFGTAPTQIYASVLGLTPVAWGSVSLAGLLGPGCALEVDWTSVVFGVTNGAGDAIRLLAVPGNPIFGGLHVYSQFLVGPQAGGSVTLILDVSLH